MVQFALEMAVCAIHQPPMIATIQEVSLDASQVCVRARMYLSDNLYPIPRIFRCLFRSVPC